MRSSFWFEKSRRCRRIALCGSLMTALASSSAYAEQPPRPCHPNLQANADIAAVENRGDIVDLPAPLKNQLVRIASRPHSQLPTQAYAEAHTDTPPFKPKPSQLFQYYLLDISGFEPNPFASLIPGVNDKAMLTATGADCGLPTIGAVRVVLEPSPACRPTRITCAHSSMYLPTSRSCS